MEKSTIPPETILKELNRARTKPLQYAALVQKQIDSFVDDWKMPLVPNCYYRTNEGIGVWKQTLAFLKNQKPLHEYKLNEGLNYAADDHVADLASHNLFGHVSSNGESMTDRIQFRCGKFYGQWGQNVGTAFNIEGINFAQQTILGLIIDDGVANRGHRKAVYSSTYKYIGSSSRVSNDNKVITVINYHTEDLKLINKDKKVNGEKIKKNENMNMNMNIKPTFKEEKIVSTGQSGDGKKVISTSTSTKVSKVNGKTTQIKVTKLKYSDGSTEQITEQKTY